MGAVVHPGTTHLDKLAGADHRRVADHRDQVPLAPRLDPQHAEAVLRVMERHPLHEFGQSSLAGAWAEFATSFAPFQEFGFSGSPYRRHE